MMGEKNQSRYISRDTRDPNERSPAITRRPPKKRVTAYPATRRKATPGKYHATARAARMLASKYRSFTRPKRTASSSSRVKACTTRTPVMPSCSEASTRPICSRTSR